MQNIQDLIKSFEELGYTLNINEDKKVFSLNKLAPRSRIGFKLIWAYRYTDFDKMQSFAQEKYDTIKANLDYKVKYKEEQKIQKQQLKEQVQVGDVFRCSWGFEQTNLDFYKIVEKRGSKVLVQEIGHKSVETTSWCSENVQIDEDNLIGEPFYKILNGDTIKFSSFQTARKMKNKYEKCYRSWGY